VTPFGACLQADDFDDSIEEKAGKRHRGQDIICSLGQSRCLFWQLFPQTVIFRYD
jgi:hypothetical protein